MFVKCLGIDVAVVVAGSRATAAAAQGFILCVAPMSSAVGSGKVWSVDGPWGLVLFASFAGELRSSHKNFPIKPFNCPLPCDLSLLRISPSSFSHYPPSTLPFSSFLFCPGRGQHHPRTYLRGDHRVNHRDDRARCDRPAGPLGHPFAQCVFRRHALPRRGEPCFDGTRYMHTLRTCPADLCCPCRVL